MTKILVIAEKPDMGKKIAQALNGPMKSSQGCIYTKDATVSWAIGHLLESGKPQDYDEKWQKFDWNNLPMFPEKWITKVTSTKSSQFKILKELIKEHDLIINAGDPGREGQLIVDEILDYVKCKKPVKRLLLPELRPAAIQKAWNEMKDNKEYYNLYQAGLARGYADWLVGLNFTQAYTLLGQKSGHKGVLSVGRVQSPTLSIVVKRDLEIENFIPKDYFTIKGNITSKNNSIAPFFSLWKNTEKTPSQVLDEDFRLIDKKFAESIMAKCKNKDAKVIKFEVTEGSEYPPLTFSLSKLQSFANNKYSIGAKDILESCQSLYEHHDAQSYPRSDCQYLPEAAHSDGAKILNIISQSFPEFNNIISKADTKIKHKVWDDTKLTDHYAIIPTVIAPKFVSLSDHEKKIYKTVCQRYIAQFYPPCKYKTVVVELLIEGEVFRSTGKIITDPGWKFVYSGESLDEDTNEESNQKIPNLKVGDVVYCDKIEIESKKTKPPARFTEGSLIETMANIHTLVSDPQQKAILKEKKGIGREATRTQIIENLIKRDLINRDGKKIISSSSGRGLIQALPNKITDPVLTAVWEDALDKIAGGTVTLENFMSKQKAWVQQLIEQAKTTEIKIAPKLNNTATSSSVSNKKTTALKTTNKTSTPINKNSWQENMKIKVDSLNANDLCPKCKKGKMTEKTAKSSGKTFLGCNLFPKCDYTKWN